MFGERARHFSLRLENSLAVGSERRSAVVDRLFASEAGESLERMHDALAALPPDAYVLKLEASELVQQAELLDLYGIVHLARQLLQILPHEPGELEIPSRRQALLDILQQLATALLPLAS